MTAAVAACPHPRRARAVATLAALALLALPALSACSRTGAEGEAAAATIGPNRSLVADGGQFLATCNFSHQGMDDPIVHHGMPGMSHLHEFFGNASTGASSTGASLLKSRANCSDFGDHSAYWVPALYVNGKVAPPRRVDAYYRVASGVEPSEVKPFPFGLQALAGDQMSTTPQPLGVVAWACGMSPALSSAPPSGCGPDRPLQLRLTFPSCWNGADTASADHTSHLAYPSASGCPRSHPVAVPQLTLVVHYSVVGDVREAHLASGDITTAHGDFFDAWTPARMHAQVSGCLDRSVVCGIVGGTFHTGQGSGDVDNYNLTS